jgi:hypothetical protein
VIGVRRGRRAEPRAVPLRVAFADPAVRNLVGSQPASRPLVGLAAGRVPVSVDVADVCPHVLVVSSAGRASRAVMRGLAAQLVHNGAGLSVVDVLGRSHDWARGLPGVGYWWMDEEIHVGLLGLADRLRDAGHVDSRRHVLVVEDLNYTCSLLKQWWRSHRESTDSTSSPAVEALRTLLAAGRQPGVHVLARSVGAPSLGVSPGEAGFGARIVIRAGAWTVQSVVPELPAPTPVHFRHPGRLLVANPEGVTETQALEMTEVEAREWAACSGGGEVGVPTSPASPPPGSAGGRDRGGLSW